MLSSSWMRRPYYTVQFTTGLIKYEAIITDVSKICLNWALSSFLIQLSISIIEAADGSGVSLI